MKFWFVILSLFWLYLIYLIISTVIEHGIPTHPVYHVSAVFGVINGYIGFWMDKNREKIVATHQRLGQTIAILTMILVIVSMTFYYWCSGIINLIGKGYWFWFFFSMIGFWIYSRLKKTAS